MAQRYIQIDSFNNIFGQSLFISFSRIFLLACLSLFQACTTTTNNSEAVIIDERSVEGEPQCAPTQTAPAISSLLVQSQAEVRSGNLDEGARILERALRIEPANPEIWYRMAQIKFMQSDYAQAAVTASRSNTFVGNNTRLRALNLGLMLESYKATGDDAQVDRVRAQIDRLEQP